jgi:murein DD-endopeptidase MepM/ murein hydrolase activator NlpD
MVDSTDTFLYKMRFLVGIALIIFGLLLLPIFVSLITSTPKVQAANTSSSANSTDMEDSPNVITSGMFSAADGLGKTANSAGQTVNSAANSIASASAQTGKVLVHGVNGSATFVARGVGGSFGFMAHTTGRIFGVITHPPTISNIIRPADKARVEVINAPAQAYAPYQDTPAQKAPEQAPQPQADTAIQWPIHGTITTEFGVPHMPYQKYHTGIDISDGARAGVTPIHPFKSGRVVEVVHSNVSLGNHVVIDNGNGITSVYGHMYSTAVQVGQQVDKNSILGTEGSTGASTGVHVHFEVYLNGTLQNPHNFVSGRP